MGGPTTRNPVDPDLWPFFTVGDLPNVAAEHEALLPVNGGDIGREDGQRQQNIL